MRAREVNRRIERLGGVIVRQRGSHRLYQASRSSSGGAVATTIVAQHPGDIPKGTLHQIERDLAPVFGGGC